MASVVHLSLQDFSYEENIIDNNKVCVCCTSQNDVLIKYAGCKHTRFLETNVKFKLKLKNQYICLICHNMLKKIEMFRIQAEESIALLLDQAPILKINKLHNFQRSTTEIDGTPQPDIYFDIKPEQIESDFQNIDTDVKIEHDNSDFETETPLPTPKREKKSKIDKYDGKIRAVILSEKELQEEREWLANNENYLKLPYKCEDCVTGFDHELTFINHIETRHKKKKNGIQCEVCKSVLGSKMSYNEHTKRHVRRLECLLCGRRFKQMLSAVQHYDEQHAAAGAALQQGYTCKDCGFTTKSNRSYRYHLDKHKNKQTCNLCGNTFVNANGLKVHMYTVHKQSSRLYKCEKCDKSYRARSGLMSHARSAHGGVRAFCVLCRTYYSTQKALEYHLNTNSNHISDIDKKFICNECGAKFVKKSSLKIHINWEHLKLQTHRCTKCDKVFKSSTGLKRHVEYVHNKRRPPRDKICDYCGRGFTTQTILQSHIRTHTGERPLSCTQCPATFAHSAALYTHNKLLHKAK